MQFQETLFAFGVYQLLILRKNTREFKNPWHIGLPRPTKRTK